MSPNGFNPPIIRYPVPFIRDQKVNQIKNIDRRILFSDRIKWRRTREKKQTIIQTIIPPAIT